MQVQSLRENPSLINLLERELVCVDEAHLIENYHPDYKDNTANLFYIIKQGRFAKGNYYVLFTDDGKFAGCAGWNELNRNTALALVRAYIPKQYRTNYIMGENILPKILEETRDYPKVWLTFNEYNKVMYDGFERMSKNKSSSLLPWPFVYRKFRPIGQHTVNNTLQYVAEYERNDQEHL
jgi:hypothetical protein